MFGLRKAQPQLHVFWKLGNACLTPDGPGRVIGFAQAEAHGAERGVYMFRTDTGPARHGLPVDGPFVVLLERVPSDGQQIRGYVYDELKPHEGGKRNAGQLPLLD